MNDEELHRVLARVTAPLVEADNGELYLVPHEEHVHLHLRGRFSGCPGNGLVVEHVFRPAIHAVLPHAEVRVTSGVLVPAGAVRIVPESVA